MNQLINHVFDNQMQLYLVRHSETHLQNALPNCYHYFALLRATEHDNIHALALVNDLWHFFYYKQQDLFFDSSNMMYYNIRASALQILTTQDIVLKIKCWTEHHVDFALLAAIGLTNIYLDLYDAALTEQMKNTKFLPLFMQFRTIDTKILFSEQFKMYVEHPRDFTEMQAQSVKFIHKSLPRYEQQLHVLLQQYAERMKKIYVIKKDIFN